MGAGWPIQNFESDSSVNLRVDIQSAGGWVPETLGLEFGHTRGRKLVFCRVEITSMHNLNQTTNMYLCMCRQRNMCLCTHMCICAAAYDDDDVAGWWWWLWGGVRGGGGRGRPGRWRWKRRRRWWWCLFFQELNLDYVWLSILSSMITCRGLIPMLAWR